ncbi:radical SAM/SPASM domain-containing protein [Dactylosporangium sp. CA-092794]|uniref:radical SAM/SPASM domain-containing protein n=1 Tax=Dactylosporangium sp. CA-092794 TaxID=3239929 RepID=UPI003D8D5B79
MPLTGPDGILQVHPTRRCNLRCLHCYSDSGPSARDELAIGTLHDVVSDAAELGYRVLSVSGGEPLMYRLLPDLLEHAHGNGMRTLVTTNGTLTSARRLERLAAHLDLLAMSLDGPPDEHDLMRAKPGAFNALCRGLESLRASGIAFGFLFTLTQYNVHQLEWAAQFAIEQGASLLQVHPLEATGRGAALLDSVADDTERSIAVLEVARLRRAVGDRIHVHLDLAVRGMLSSTAECDPCAPLARLVSPLVVEPDGRCVPLEYGFPDAFALGNVLDHRLIDLAAAWRADVLPQFNQICRDAAARLAGPDAPAASNWYTAVTAAAVEAAAM